MGNSWIYSESVEDLENNNNNVTLNRIKSALFVQEKYKIIGRSTALDKITSNFESHDKKMFSQWLVLTILPNL